MRRRITGRKNFLGAATWISCYPADGGQRARPVRRPGEFRPHPARHSHLIRRACSCSANPPASASPATFAFALISGVFTSAASAQVLGLSVDLATGNTRLTTTGTQVSITGYEIDSPSGATRRRQLELPGRSGLFLRRNRQPDLHRARRVDPWCARRHPDRADLHRQRLQRRQYGARHRPGVPVRHGNRCRFDPELWRRLLRRRPRARDRRPAAAERRPATASSPAEPFDRTVRDSNSPVSRSKSWTRAFSYMPPLAEPVAGVAVPFLMSQPLRFNDPPAAAPRTLDPQGGSDGGAGGACELICWGLSTPLRLRRRPREPERPTPAARASLFNLTPRPQKRLMPH